ncbi:hypothetical protein KR044_007281, partial [Drosophila immigrans]
VAPVCSSASAPMIPACNDNTVVNSSGSTADVPTASGSSDVSTFGTTKMFSFLYPTRYQRTYGQVGLDFCCPNLNGPMQAIDPTRLHSKAEVPVLELPQYMVISTKIISKQDKNIPQKVRAKLEQMAAKDGQPCVVQSVQLSGPSAPAATPALPSEPVPLPVLAPALAPAPIPTLAFSSVSSPATASAPTLGHIERLAKPLSLTLPRSALLTKKTNPTAAAVAPNVASSQAVDNAPPAATVNPLAGLLQLPPICPADKQRVELQTRIQLFDLTLQNLAKSVTSMTLSERQRVIENFVRKTTLQPIDVEVGTKLLENYVYHLSATADNGSVAIPNRRPITSSTSTPAVTSQPTSNSSAAEAVSKTPDPEAYSRPIYDRSRNVIGYEYKKPRLSLLSSTSSSKNPQQQTPPTMTPSTAASNKPQVAASAGASRAAQRVSSGNKLPCKPSPKEKTLSRSANKSQMLQITPIVAVDIARPSNTQPSTSTTVGASNRNLYIVNQVMSQPEECILPDGVGMPDAADIKGEVDDVEMLA